MYQGIKMKKKTRNIKTQQSRYLNWKIKWNFNIKRNKKYNYKCDWLLHF